MQPAISFNLSEWAKTFDAKIISAFFFIFLSSFFSRKQLIVLILFLLASLAKFLAGSIPSIFLNFKSLNGFKATPSLLPISIIYDFFGLSLKSFMYFLAALTKWFLNEVDVYDVYK